jgi:Fic family protein
VAERLHEARDAMSVTTYADQTPSPASSNARRALSRRIQSEYEEMPGLSLTISQAIRFWNLDAPTCARVLEELVEQGYLRRSGNHYRRAF